mmetsp:Transcript_55869/g.121542  ORF Transcript_55869/g.121542 Transcript_55869/m.121542 type:complete len:87 (+) Transcript_55869:632-892(+)
MHVVLRFKRLQVIHVRAGLFAGANWEGARALSEALQCCPSLTTLNLAHRELGRESARALSEAWPHCSALSQLQLSGNKIGAQGMCS